MLYVGGAVGSWSFTPATQIIRGILSAAGFAQQYGDCTFLWFEHALSADGERLRVGTIYKARSTSGRVSSKRDPLLLISLVWRLYLGGQCESTTPKPSLTTF